MRVALAVAVVLALLPGRRVSASPEILKGPWLEAPTTASVTVLWETSEPLPGVLHLVDPSGGGDRVLAETGTPTRLHILAATGLEPGRRYGYFVTSGPLTSDRGTLAAAPLPYEPFTFIVFGDNRNRAEDHRAVVDRFVRDAPDLVLNTGDLTDKGLPDEWQEFFAIEHEALRDAPLAPTLGNHDLDGLRTGNLGFRTYFPLLGSSAPSPELYYAFSFGNARFVVLDTNAYLFALSDETAWLERELRAARANPSIRHLFVFMHHPALSSSSHGGSPGIREAWGPIFARYQVDDVFAGHDHAYERCEESGIRYLVTGGGGAPLYSERNPADDEDRSTLITFEKVHHYIRVSVVGDFVALSVIRDDGSVIEALEQGRKPTGACERASDCAGLSHASCQGGWSCEAHTCRFACGATTTVVPSAEPPSLSAGRPGDGSGYRTVRRPAPRSTGSHRLLGLLAVPLLVGATGALLSLRRRH